MNHMDNDFMQLGGLDDTTVEEIAESYPAPDEESRTRIEKLFLEKTSYSDIGSDITDTDDLEEPELTVSGTEIYRRPKWYSLMKYVSTAAAFVLAAVGIGGFIAINRHTADDPLSAGDSSVIEQGSSPAPAATAVSDPVTVQATKAAPIPLSTEPSPHETAAAETAAATAVTETSAAETTTETAPETTAVSDTTSSEVSTTTAAAESTPELSTETSSAEEPEQPSTVPVTAAVSYIDDPVSYLEGHWLAVYDSGLQLEYFFEPLEGNNLHGRNSDLELGIGIPFDLEVNGYDLMFHMASVEDNTPAVISIETDGFDGETSESRRNDAFTLTWEDGSTAGFTRIYVEYELAD